MIFVGGFYNFYMDMVFGKYFKPLLDFVSNNIYLIGFIGGIYAAILFYGVYFSRKYLPEKFEAYVIEEASQILNNNQDISVGKLTDMVYKKWVEGFDDLPSYIRITRAKEFWIEKPTLEALDERIGINKDRIKEIFVDNGIIRIDK